MVFGNVGVSDWHGQLQDVLDLSIAAGDRWQEAISRNDIACWHQHEGRTAEAEEEIERGLDVARELERNRFALGVLHSTRSDIRLLGGEAWGALAAAAICRVNRPYADKVGNRRVSSPQGKQLDDPRRGGRPCPARC